MSSTLLVDPSARRSSLRKAAAWPLALLLTAAILGLAIAALSERYFAILFGPLALLITIIFWAMPAPRTVPLHIAWLALVGTLGLTIVWPSYIALRLPGLPWINMPRLLMSMFLVLWLYCLFNSSTARRQLLQDLRDYKPIFLFLLGWIVVMVLGIAKSHNPADSITRIVNFQLSNTVALLAVVSLVRTPAQLRLLAIVILCAGAFVMANGLIESRLQSIIWLKFNPPGFSTDEKFVTELLEGVWREGNYRVQGPFFVSLSYAECLVLTLPFAYYFLLNAKSWMMRYVFIAYILISAPAIYVSHSRLGVVGFFLVGMTYAGFFAMRSWWASKTNLFGPILALLFPVLIVSFLGAVTVSNRLQTAMIGDGGTQSSDDGRALQRKLAIPAIMRSPIVGYGMAQGGIVAGFTMPNGAGTFDNYILLVALDNGIPGLLCFLGFVGWCILRGSQTYLMSNSELSKMAGALAVYFIVFLVIRWVLAQQENHQFVMAVAGMLVSILRMEKQNKAEASASGAAEPAAAHTRR
ncbi:MAG TPA: O-antigen ligase family protein [Pseudolabrys sp.]|nr:O-antigen ligase family protein [Pseudolabrys sp.]